MATIPEALAIAIQHHQSGRLQSAEQIYRQILELKPEKLVLYSLTSNEAVESTRDAKALKETRERIAQVADLIRAREFVAKPGFGCKFCDYRPICPSHEQLVSIRGSADAVMSEE